MAKRNKRTWRWVTRDKSQAGLVSVWPAEKPLPIQNEWGEYWVPGNSSASVSPANICPAEFRRLFGWMPPTDRPVKVRFSAVVEE